MPLSDPEERRRYAKAYYQKNREKVRAQVDRYRTSSKGLATSAAWKQAHGQFERHGLTKEQHQLVLDEQGGVCAICKLPPRKGQSLCVDHDHTCCPLTGSSRSCGRCFRGLLCHNCNQALGKLNDDPDRLEAGISYLRRGRRSW